MGEVYLAEDTKLRRNVSLKWTAWLEPRYVLRLARYSTRTAIGMGRVPSTNAFLDLSKDADRGVPEIDEARRYLAN